ncbi:MAG: hypothetical protein KUG78_17955 [Kangiellaceae bacterium]|nr:hypothetical protein [Kangiellaceae bacterium]
MKLFTAWGTGGSLRLLSLSQMIKRLFIPTQWSLGKKITSIVLLILIVPLASIGLLKEIERTLVDSLRDNLALSSQLIANGLVIQPDWFTESLLPDSNNFIGKELFVFPLGPSFVPDGYFDEWQGHELNRSTFKNDNSELSLLLGSHKNSLVISMSIVDDELIFPLMEDNGLSDSIEIEFVDHNGSYHYLLLEPTGAGEFAVKTIINSVAKNDWRYKAFWLSRSGGFSIEVKFPSGIKPRQIKVVHKDIDRQGAKEYRALNSSSIYDWNPMVWPSKQFSNYFENLKLKPAQRIWLIDHFGRVLASSGDLNTNKITFSRNSLMNWILSNQNEIVSDPRENNLHLDSEGIVRAMKGIASTRLEYFGTSNNAVAIAAHPVQILGEVKGVLLLEENVARVQVLQQKALLKMFGIILVVFVLVIWTVFWYVKRTVNRIKFLNNEIEKVVDYQGRISSPLQLSVESGDEINDLYRSFSHMSDKLYEYNDYLEKLAARLSHELRTPIAIVRSSLDNLSLNCSSNEDQELINRAIEGNQRLGEIINRMKQASGVKEAMQSAETEWVDINQLMERMVQGYQASFQHFEFQFVGSKHALKVELSIDLFSEMIDKLISNAMDFSEVGEPIIIGAKNSKSGTVVYVENSGQLIPEKMKKRIFQSLVSIRNTKQASGTNLGLGLYLVKLIADFHRFEVKAINREDGSGVIFQMSSDSKLR